MEQFKVVRSNIFQKSLKKYKKKHRSLPQDVYLLENALKCQIIGTNLFPWDAGNDRLWNVYKIRLNCKSLNKGKSGGYRVIYGFDQHDSIILLITMYFKSDFGTLTDSDIQNILRNLDFSL